MCVFSSHLFWTSGLWTYDVPARATQAEGITQDFSSTFLLRCLPSFFSREGFSHSFSSSTVKSNIVYERFNRSPLVGHFFFFSIFSCGKIPVTGIRTHVPTCQKVSRLPTEPPGRPAWKVKEITNNICISIVGCRKGYGWAGESSRDRPRKTPEEQQIWLNFCGVSSCCWEK